MRRRQQFEKMDDGNKYDEYGNLKKQFRTSGASAEAKAKGDNAWEDEIKEEATQQPLRRRPLRRAASAAAAAALARARARTRLPSPRAGAGAAGEGAAGG